jgi:hypothetical protein
MVGTRTTTGATIARINWTTTDTEARINWTTDTIARIDGAGVRQHDWMRRCAGADCARWNDDWVRGPTGWTWQTMVRIRWGRRQRIARLQTTFQYSNECYE